MYADGDYDIAGFAVGAVEREDMITGETITAGDVVLGLASSGIHSNGFSLVRHVLTQSGHSYESPAPFAAGKTLGQALITPTRLYVKNILAALKSHKGAVHGMVHVTGGGFTENIPRVLPDNCAVDMDCAVWELPPMFKWLAEHGKLTADDLADTFNCGIGFILIVAADKADALTASLKARGEMVYTLGKVIKREAEPLILRNRDMAWLCQK
jgi:phosphoribosylformylglycinamidine cyclo-ligase